MHSAPNEVENQVEEVAKKGATFAAGLALKNILNWPFDYILYPVVLVSLGNAVGGGVMTVLSVFYNVFIIRLYDWSKTDWLLIESVKGLRDEKPVGKWKRMVAFLLKKSKVLAFFILCLDDPITVTLYLRPGSHRYNGLAKNDWLIFFAATVVSNLYWIIGWSAVIEGFQYVVSLWW